MPPRRNHSSKPSLGLDCGLTVPKFLQPYQDMLGENSVFKSQIRKEKEEAWDNQQEVNTEQQELNKESTSETTTKTTDSTHMTEKEREKKDRILSNKNNDLVRELSKKLVSGEKKEKTQTKIISVGSNALKKKEVSKPKPTIKPKPQKKGMLTFDEESDSDHL